MPLVASACSVGTGVHTILTDPASASLCVLGMLQGSVPSDSYFSSLSHNYGATEYPVITNPFPVKSAHVHFWFQTDN